jgi:quercetin dioxygenase-like cupin family protein
MPEGERYTHADTEAKGLGGKIKEGSKKEREGEAYTHADLAARAMGASKEGKKKLFHGPLKVAPNIYKQLLGNDRVCVFDVHFKPNAKAGMHVHRDHIVYVIKGGTLKLEFHDGTSKKLNLKNGQTMWLKEQSHAAENTGKDDLHLFVIKLR